MSTDQETIEESYNDIVSALKERYEADGDLAQGMTEVSGILDEVYTMSDNGSQGFCMFGAMKCTVEEWSAVD